MFSRRFARPSHSAPVGCPPLCVANRILRCIAPRLLLDAQELRKESVEVVHAALAGGGVPAAVVEARAHPALDRLDDRLVLALDAIETRAHAGVALGRVPHEWEERDTRSVDGERRD